MTRLLCFAIPLLAASLAQAQGVELRPIDRATVRVIGVSGMQPSPGTGRTTGVRRVGAEPSMGHGSGVAIGPRLILTARHVVWGMHAWTVVPPGESDPIPARPVYVDLEHDIAFVAVDRDLPHHLSLPDAPRRLTMSERVSVSGYPLDVREPNPAASSGEVSRVTRDGLLHLSMSVNPGNSGGPVIDRDGALIGIVSMRGRPDEGVAGLTIAVPIAFVNEARARVPSEAPSFAPYEAELSRAISLLAALSDEELSQRRTEIQTLVEHGERARDASPEHRLIFAALGWNTVLTIMEHERARESAQLSAASRAQVAPIYRASVAMARNALRDAPHVRRAFPAARAIALGRVSPFRD